MSNPALTTTLTLLLVAEQNRAAGDTESFDYAIYDVVNHLVDLAGWSDEKKADLYAMLAECLHDKMRMVEIETHVRRCLIANDRRF